VTGNVTQAVRCAEPANPVGREASGGPKKIYRLLGLAEAVHIDDIVERSGLNWSEVLATLFDLDGSCGRCRVSSFTKVLLWFPEVIEYMEVA
jgi:hypothetical protein